MEFEDTKKFLFVSKALPEDTFAVVRFEGNEGISKIYSFDITLVSDDPEIDLKEILQNPATLTILGDHQDLPVHGILAQFEQLHEVKHHYFYRAVLVPRLWLSNLYHENQLFLDRTVPDIIEDILKQAGLTTQDYELRLTKEYPQWEYICQYRETDYEFISRWMEREGIYFFFEQTEDYEKLVITDSFTAHQDIKGDAMIPYAPPSGLVPEEELIQAFISRQKMLPNKVILKDYNYRKPSLELKAEAIVDQQGRGDVYLYGEHFKDPEQGSALAKIRAEEIACRANVFHGEGTATNLTSGYQFELVDHYREGFNRKYLILDIEHEGIQAASFLSGLGEDLTEKEQTRTYTNRFTAIEAGVQFRPERTTPRPRIQGTMNALVDAAGDGKYAELDDQGRYKIILPFDLSGNNDGRASRWVRMAQPYAGAEYGMHFPLHKGTEVLLTFIDGDPDRPIIASAVPNPATASPVNTENQSESVIKTGGNNKIRIEDREDSERIIMQSPKVNSFIRIGTPNDPIAPISVPGDIIYIVQNEDLPTGWSDYSVNPGFVVDPSIYDGASATDADRGTKKIKVTYSSSDVHTGTPGKYNITFTATEFLMRQDPISGTWTWRALTPQTYTRSVHVIEEQEKEFVKDVKEGDGIKIMTDGGIELYTGNPGMQLKKAQDINIMTDQNGAPEGDINIEAYNIDTSCRGSLFESVTDNQASFVGGNTFETGIGNTLSIKGGTENSILIGGKLEAGFLTKMETFVGSSFELGLGAKYELFQGAEYDAGFADWKKHSDKEISIDATNKIEVIGGKKNNSKITGTTASLEIQYGQYGESIADNPKEKFVKYCVPTMLAHLVLSSITFFITSGIDNDRGNKATDAGLGVGTGALAALSGAIALILYLSFKKKKEAVEESMVPDETHSRIYLDKEGLTLSSEGSRIKIEKDGDISLINDKKIRIRTSKDIWLTGNKIMAHKSATFKTKNILDKG